MIPVSNCNHLIQKKSTMRSRPRPGQTTQCDLRQMWTVMDVPFDTKCIKIKLT